jgi:glycine betaine/choline ABC-type transport system substrate-binding protein
MEMRRKKKKVDTHTQRANETQAVVVVQEVVVKDNINSLSSLASLSQKDTI